MLSDYPFYRSIEVLDRPICAIRPSYLTTQYPPNVPFVQFFQSGHGTVLLELEKDGRDLHEDGEIDNNGLCELVVVGYSV